MSTTLQHALFWFIATSAIGLASYYLLLFALRRWGKKENSFMGNLVQQDIHWAGLLLIIIAIVHIGIYFFRDLIPENIFKIIQHCAQILQISVIAYFLIKIIKLAKDLFLKLQEQKTGESYELRAAKTKYVLLQRIANLLIIVFAIIAILTTFEELEKFGATILASAGVAGIIIGFAAQKSLGTFFAGLQIAFTQPIKIGDIVAIGEYFGSIGEITLTYAVMHTWDEKRLIIPINYFLENSIENWTRSSPEVVAQVHISTDYTLPINAIRSYFFKILEESPLWDKRKKELLVTKATENTIEIRATMTCKDSDDAWDLECYVREELISYISNNYPESLPKSRYQ